MRQARPDAHQFAQPGMHSSRDRWQTEGVTTSAGQDPQAVAVPLRWNLTGVPTLLANQFLATIGPPTANGTPDGVYVVLGSAAPPIIIGEDPEAQRPYIEAAVRDGVTVDVHGRFYITRERLGELIQGLESVRDKFDIAVSTPINVSSATGSQQ